MPRYLSSDWFAAVADAGGEPVGEAGADSVDLVLEQEVRGTPDGTVVYRVEVAGAHARLVWPVPADATPPDLHITSDWETAVAVARGELSTQRALMHGRLRFSGRSDRLATVAGALAGVDPVPGRVRAATTFDET